MEKCSAHEGWFDKYPMNWMKSWPGWIFFISAGVLWGLPRVPYYQEGLPYIYDLGGPALVAWHIGLGFLSLGLYVIVTACVSVCVSRVKRLQALLFGGGALILAGGFSWLYLILLRISVMVR